MFWLGFASPGGAGRGVSLPYVFICSAGSSACRLPVAGGGREGGLALAVVNGNVNEVKLLTLEYGAPLMLIE